MRTAEAFAPLLPEQYRHLSYQPRCLPGPALVPSQKLQATAQSKPNLSSTHPVIYTDQTGQDVPERYGVVYLAIFDHHRSEFPPAPMWEQ